MKRQKRLTGVDEMVISPDAKGLTTGEAQAHQAEVCGADVSPETRPSRRYVVAPMAQQAVGRSCTTSDQAVSPAEGPRRGKSTSAFSASSPPRKLRLPVASAWDGPSAAHDDVPSIAASRRCPRR